MLSALFSIIIEPLIYIVELAYALSYKVLQNPGLAIACVSVVVNFLCLPLYSMADAQQQAERDKQKSMERWVNHIKEHFKGDEQYMILTTYYRQQGYRQVSALSSSISLLLQIPIFIAAYRYLSDLPVLLGARFLFIQDLSVPDQLLHVGGFAINVLPIAMTLLNVASSAVYTRDLALRDKLQTYGLAGLFLVLLYNSPSGLVMYWTCNQIFSLVKNLFQKVIPDGRRVFTILAEAVLVCGYLMLLLTGRLDLTRKLLFVTALVLVLQIPLLAPYVGSRLSARLPKALRGSGVPFDARQNLATFLLAALTLVAIMGVMIPSALLGDSPAEFVNLNFFVHPLSFVAHNTEICLGLFVLWVGVFYFLSDERGKQGIALLLWVLVGICAIDYLFFGRGLGVISSELQYDKTPKYSIQERVTNIAVIAGVIAVFLTVWKRNRKLVNPVLGITLIAVLGVSAPDIAHIKTTVDSMIATGAQGDADGDSATAMVDENGEPLPIFTFSKNGKNVAVLFMDRAVGMLVPYILQERPDLVNQLDGFTYYQNALSFGGYTVFGAPPLYGGYEYTPTEMNARSDELMRDKNNEAIRVMPTLFSRADYDVVVTDPAYLDYQNNTYDFSSLSDIDNLKAFHTIGAYAASYYPAFAEMDRDSMPRRFVYYSIFKCAPVFAQRTIYNKGSYLSAFASSTGWRDFLDNYSVIDNLCKLTKVVDDDSDNFLLLHSLLTHCPFSLQLPEYEALPIIDNTGLEKRRRSAEGMPEIALSNSKKLETYHVNMAFFLKFGAWCDYLKEQGVYDNTRIIVVSDHGTKGVRMLDELWFDESNSNFDATRYNPLMMVKDFGETGPLETSWEFMTNADTPTIAMEGLIENPVNPATGKPIDSSEKTAHPQVVTTSMHWNQRSIVNDTTYNTSDSPFFSVHDNIYIKENWEMVE